MEDTLLTPEFGFLLFFAFTAGFIDAIAGGGGLIQLPAFFLAFPALPPAVILGSNKFAAFSGTSVATVRYLKNTSVPWRDVIPAIITALIFSVIGARLVSLFDKELFKPIVLILLVLVAIYTFIRKDFGLKKNEGLNQNKRLMIALLSGMLLGIYDGFFGPGTGSFLMVIYISIFGFDFLQASVSAKLVNCATNFAALAYFAATGNIRYELAIPVAICNILGSLIGVRLALLKGSGFIRGFFLLVVCGMIIKFGWEIYAG
ncbi:MAG: TSUP family transporter [Bacteroidia bacterium]